MIPFIKPILSLDHSNLGNMGCFSSKPLAPGLERERGLGLLSSSYNSCMVGSAAA